ncbi:DUF6286 domain-containing protein [Streptomyces sp. RFCAC02]|uniref:DUF6286 domain-containing protein n=1 Tax=Streptomyces sp. RFCAC02 TaxID=2499143 RepID=UPI00101ECA97|nr:DUF6286 domain-containing protein [Streptomyces sp. RFCAC02]
MSAPPGTGAETGTERGEDRPPARDGRAAGRFWSERRVPAALTAAAVVVTCGPLLYDVIAVRADRPAAQWRRRLADDLAARAVDGAWVVTGCVVAVLLGAWLLALALTPGLRTVLPMRRRAAEHVRAGIERGAAAVVLRDRALEVSGVRAVRVKAGGRRVTVWAEAHFRDLDVVRADLDAVLTDAVRGLGLARQPSLTVHVHRPAKR